MITSIRKRPHVYVTGVLYVVTSIATTFFVYECLKEWKQIVEEEQSQEISYNENEDGDGNDSVSAKTSRKNEEDDSKDENTIHVKECTDNSTHNIGNLAPLISKQTLQDDKTTFISRENFFQAYATSSFANNLTLEEITIFWNGVGRGKFKTSSVQLVAYDEIVHTLQNKNHPYKEELLSIALDALNMEQRKARYSHVQKQNSIRALLNSTRKRVQDIAGYTSVGMQSIMRRTVRHYLRRGLDSVTPLIKNKIKDKDMPDCVQKIIDRAVDQIMPDVKQEVLSRTEDLFIGPSQFKYRIPKLSEKKILSPQSSAVLRVYHIIRSHILYHLFPYDKSMWSSFKDPFWCLYNGIGLIPYFGQLWWIFLFFLKDKTNEYQLCQFIIGFKVSHFLSMGLLSSFIGILFYIRCTTNSNLNCSTDGPLLSGWASCFFIIQIVIVWLSFFRLPYTQRYPNFSIFEDKKEQNKSIEMDVFGNRLHWNRGGALIALCGYETISICLVISIGVLLLYLPYETWQKEAWLYWLRTFYGLLSIPFIAFRIPLIEKIFIRIKKMGYDADGQTAPYDPK